MYDSKSQTTSSFVLGTPNSSVPVVGNFDANAPDEAGVYTDVNGQGMWTIASAITGLRQVTLPFPVLTGDIPEPGDYDGVGFDELAIYRPTTGQYLVDKNGTTETINIPGISASTPGLSSLVPVPGAYDNLAYFNNKQPERDEAAVYNPNTGVFTILGPNGVVDPVPSGFQKGDIPAPADYLGNGSTQPAVFRPSTGQFIGAGGTIIATLGQSSNIPLAAPLSYRMPGFQSAGQTGGGSTGTGSTGTGSTGTGFNGDGFNGDGFNRDGLNGDGFNRDGFNRDGLNGDGFNRDGLNGIHTAACPKPWIRSHASRDQHPQEEDREETQAETSRSSQEADCAQESQDRSTSCCQAEGSCCEP